MQQIKPESPATGLMKAEIAESEETITKAKKLRFDVFKEEYGASFGEHSLDEDEFDPHCHHLVVFLDDQVVATTRILTNINKEAIGNYYSETEFELPDTIRNADQLMEIGRTCIHPDHRSGPALNLLWMGIARFLLQNNYRYMIGCGSISIKDNGQYAWSISQALKKSFPSTDAFKVKPKRAMPHLASTAAKEIENEEIPSLLRAYTRLGAKICGDPCWDPAFKTADVFILLDAEEIPARYRKRFMRG